MILVTSAYKQEQVYTWLYCRVRTILTLVIERHKHLVSGAGVKCIEDTHIFVRHEHHRANGEKYFAYEVTYGLDMWPVQPDVLLYLCFLLYLGGQVTEFVSVVSPPRLSKAIDDLDNPGLNNFKFVSAATYPKLSEYVDVWENPDLMMKILDHLINDRKYPAASFFKGLVMKYEVKPYVAGKPDEAKVLLEFALRNGVEAAAVELKQLHKHTKLDGIVSVHN